MCLHENVNLWIAAPAPAADGSLLHDMGDHGRYNGNCYSILGLYRDNGKEHGNYYMSELGLRKLVLVSW